MERLLSIEVEDLIYTALKRGNTVEIKREKDNIVVVEINRKLRAKQPLSIKPLNREG